MKNETSENQKIKVHFSSKSNEWATPDLLFQKYNEKFNFTLDAAATAENAKCAKFYTEAENGLAQDWSGETVWLNPPYGRQIGKWIRKAYEESLKGVTVVCLIPARTDTSYWHDFIFKGKAEIEYLRGRVKFGSPEYWAWFWEQEFIDGKKNKLFKKYGKKTGAPFPSAIVIYGKQINEK